MIYFRTYRPYRVPRSDLYIITTLKASSCHTSTAYQCSFFPLLLFLSFSCCVFPVRCSMCVYGSRLKAMSCLKVPHLVPSVSHD
jgi:hypothetical protein